MKTQRSKITQSAGGVVINTKGQVLVVCQKGNSWSLPKGHVEAGEDYEDTARREVYEESGVRELELERAFPMYERYKIALDGGEDDSELKQIFMFLFFTDEEVLNPVDDENPEARWVDPEKVAEVLTHPKDVQFFQSIRDQLEKIKS